MVECKSFPQKNLIILDYTLDSISKKKNSTRSVKVKYGHIKSSKLEYDNRNISSGRSDGKNIFIALNVLKSVGTMDAI